MKYLFVGEKRSDRAKKMGVWLQDGRLAAKQLFDALTYCGIHPQDQEYCNWWEGGKGRVRTWNQGPVIAMGHKVRKELEKEKIAHIFIFHPAARGTIRRKDLYCDHVRESIFPHYGY